MEVLRTLLAAAGWSMLWSAPLWAQGPQGHHAVVARLKAGSAPGITYLVRQTFNGTGYDNGESWTEGSTPNEDYATSPAPLEGTHSWLADATSKNATSPSFASSTTISVFFKFHVSTSPTGNASFVQLAGAGNGASFSGRAAGGFRIAHGADVSAVILTGVSGVVTGVWLDYVAESGGGANGTLDCYVDGDGDANFTKPGSPTLSLTAGTGDAITNILLNGVVVGNTILDVVLATTTPLGNDPS